MSDSFSYAIPGLVFKDAVPDAKRKVKNHALAGRGLEFICAVPECENTDPMVEFVHPISGYRMHTCTFHNRILRWEQRKLGHTMKTMEQAMRDIAKQNGGTLRFASLSKYRPTLGAAK